MSTGLRQIPQSELVRRAIERTGGNSWLALVVPDDRLDEIVEQVAAGVASEAELDVFRGDAPADAEHLANAVPRAGILVASLRDTWPPGAWARLDVHRSRLQRRDRSILLLSESAARHVFQEAPHFTRLFTGSVWELSPEPDEMSEADRRDRIASLERWAALSTDELLAVPLSRATPRQSRFAIFAVAVLAYLLLFSASSVVRDWLENGDVPVFPGMLLAYVPSLALLGLLLAMPRLLLHGLRG